MNNVVTRACAWVSVALLAYAPLAAAQTLEVFAGGKRIFDTPAMEVPMMPDGISVGPDGRMYINSRVQGKLLRFDPSTSTVTALPALPGRPDFTDLRDIAVAQDGTIFSVIDRQVVKVDLATGTTTPFAGGAWTNPPNCVGSPSSPATFYSVADIQPASGGRLYVADAQSNRICVVDAQGNSSLVAGTGNASFGGDGGDARLASLYGPSSLWVGPGGDLYFADQANFRIRKIRASTGVISTIAGNGSSSYNGDGISALSAGIGVVWALAVDSSGNVFFYDAGANRLRRVDAATGIITSVAGNGWFGSSGNGGLATDAQLGGLQSIIVAANGDLLFGDGLGGQVRRVSASTGIITGFIGNGSLGFCGESAPRLETCLYGPFAVATNAQSTIYVSDSGNYRIRKVDASTGVLSTIAGLPGTGNSSGDWGLAINARLGSTPGGVATDAAGNLYLSGGYDHRIRRIDAANGVITTIAGTGQGDSGGDGGLATAARINQAAHLIFDAAGNLYFSDSSAHRVRKITASTGIITTVAGWGNPNGALGDGGIATSGGLSFPTALAFDAAGNLLISDSNHARIRKVTVSTGIITTFAGNGNFSETGDGGPATAASISSPQGIARDGFGNVYLISPDSLRRIDASTGIITTVMRGPAFATAGGLKPKSPSQMTFDRRGDLYIADSAQNVVFRITGLPHPIIDETPPTVAPQLVGTVGTGGWYRSNVQLTWTVSDAESSISSSNGCGASSVTTDTSGVTFTCSATSGGGTTTRSVTIRRDIVPPTLAFGTRSPEPDVNGWNTGDVTIPFTANDALSGVFSTSSGSPLTVTGEGSNLYAQVVVTDGAGNSATFTSPPVNIDRSAPVVTPDISGTLGDNGWYTSDVQVTWTTTDNGAPVASTEGCVASSVTTDTAEVSFTCTATSAGGSTTKSVTIKRDATPPQLTFGAKDPLPYESGWNGGTVNIPFTTSDAMSGVATTSKTSPLVFAEPGTNLIESVVVTDAAGNSATFSSPRVDIDTTPPVVQAHLSGTLGKNGWYISDVVLSWSESEPDSHILSREGCFNLTLTGDAADYNFSCTVVGVGGTTTETVVIKRDVTPPQVFFYPPSSPNDSGWFNGDVAIPFIAFGDYAQVVSTSTSSPVVITGEGHGLTTELTVEDEAGNTATYTTPAVDIDRNPPAITPIVSGTLGALDWYRSDVQVSWAIDELPGSIISSNGCGNSSVIADTAGVTFTCSVVSGGGSASRSVTVKRDATPPVLTFGTPSPAPNSNGWNKTNVSISFTRSDAMSGLASTSTASPLVLATEGAGVTGQVVVTDVAGNTATFTTPPLNIDKTAPAVTLTTPANGADYGFYQDVIGDYSCTDLSLLSCVGPTANGEPVNTKTAGARTFKVTGKDLALFTTAVTNTFTVDSLFNFEGFLAPSNEPPTLNLVTRGSLVPIRWQLPDGHGGFVTNPASFTSATVGSLTCGSATVVPYPETSSGSSGISFDDSTNTFTYHWQTNAGWTGCRKLTIKLRDNTLHELRFRFQ